MPGKNTTGLPNSNDYYVGRGVVYFAPIDASTGLPKAYRDLGNCPDFTITVSSETLEHKSSRSGLKVTDKEVVISQDCDVKFTLDELNFDNWALFLSGSQATPTNPAIAGFTQDPVAADGELELGRWYDIRTAAGARAYDLTAANCAFTTREGSPVTMVLGTDYDLDLETGRIFTKSTSSVLATAIAANKGFKVVVSATAAASTLQTVEGLTTSSISGALKFVASNPSYQDDVSEIQIHKITLKADGDASLISDDFTKLPLQGKASKATGTSAGVSGKTLTITRADGLALT